MSRLPDILTCLLASSALSALAASPARADETIVVHGDAPRAGLRDLTGAAQGARDRRHALGEAAFVTRVHVDERAGESATLADAVAAGAGIHVRTFGGLGGFASISVRGASSGQTSVLVDGVPLARVASVTVDLGAFELDSFAEVDVYRGGVPAALGGAALGGALSLETRVGRGALGERLTLSAGAGSFGARHLRARWGDGDPDAGRAAVVELGYAGATGDYTYFDDGGTNLDPSDDGYRRRVNNQYDHVDLVARAAGAGDTHAWAAGLRGLWRRQGLPGATSAPAMHADLSTASLVGDGAWTVDGALGVDGLAASARGWALAEAQAYADPDGEIGLGAEERRYLTLSAGASAGAELARGRHLASAGVDARVDWFRDQDLLRGGDRVRGARLAVGVSLADDLQLGPIDLAPALRLDVLHTDPIADRYAPGMPEAPPRTELAPSPRLSARALVLPSLAVKGSAGWYFRAPTVAELYGDRGFLVGTPDLASERGPTADLGLAWAPARRHGAVDRVLVEAAAFASWPRDTIALVTTGALVARPRNVGDARIAGVEAAAVARVARTVTVTANYTLLDTAQRTATPSYDGKPLPGRPRHELYARADVARTWRGRTGVVWTDLAWMSGNYLDQAGLNAVPARHLLGAGVKLEVGGGVTLGVEARNLLDERVERIDLDPAPRPDLSTVPRAVADVGGYPLPGRAFYLAAEWRR